MKKIVLIYIVQFLVKELIEHVYNNFIQSNTKETWDSFLLKKSLEARQRKNNVSYNLSST